MRIFSRLYTRIMQWARHPRAPYYLAGLSFAEAAFFPIPVDVMLAPMALAQPQRAWRYATLATLSSVIGGLLGYVIGFTLITVLHPWLVSLGYADAYQQVVQWFSVWGIWAVVLAGFTPIPYKLFTIAAGALHMLLPGFIIASVIGRSLRFFLVATLMMWGGERMEHFLKRIIDGLGWTLLIGSLAFYVIYRFVVN